MDRRAFLASLSAAVVLGGPLRAETATERIDRQLRAQGYRDIRISRTWLGRTRILAIGKGGQREIIVNPRTGEILRDLWQATGPGGAAILEEGRGARNGVSPAAGEDDDDDSDDNDRDDDGDDRDSGDSDSDSGDGDSDGGDDD